MITNNKNFGVVWDNESNLLNKVAVYTRFLERRVNMQVTSSKSEQQNGLNRHIVDRSFLLLQQSTMDNVLFLSFFSKEKIDDSSPELIIPVGMIASMDASRVKSERGTLVMGRVILTTHATVDARLVLGPMKITIYLPFAGMQALETALKIGVSLFPEQHKKVIASPPNNC